MRLWPFIWALTFSAPQYILKYIKNDLRVKSNEELFHLCVSISNYNLIFSSVYSEALCHFIWRHQLCRWVAAYLPQWVAEGGDGECIRALPDWQLRENVYEINIAWCNAQNPAAVALEASCISHLTTSPFSLSLNLQHICKHNYTHVPQSCGYRGARRPNGVKWAVNQLQTLVSRAYCRGHAGTAKRATKHIRHAQNLKSIWMNFKVEMSQWYLCCRPFFLEQKIKMID